MATPSLTKTTDVHRGSKPWVDDVSWKPSVTQMPPSMLIRLWEGLHQLLSMESSHKDPCTVRHCRFNGKLSQPHVLHPPGFIFCTWRHSLVWCKISIKSKA